VADQALLGLITAFLKARAWVDGQHEPSRMGVPQGGPLLPVLANVVLDEMDWELHRRMANLENPGTIDGHVSEFLQRDGPATTGSGQGLRRMHSTQRTAVYVTRTHGGVEGRGREVPSYPDWASQRRGASPFQHKHSGPETR
jgi:hypothetical protein